MTWGHEKGSSLVVKTKTLMIEGPKQLQKDSSSTRIVFK